MAACRNFRSLGPETCEKSCFLCLPVLLFLVLQRLACVQNTFNFIICVYFIYKTWKIVPDIGYKDAGLTDADLNMMGVDFFLQTEEECSIADELE